MKKVFGVIALALLLSVISIGCSKSSSNESEVELLINGFVNKLYTVEYQSIPKIDIEAIKEQDKKIEPYVTADLLNKLRDNGETAISVRISGKSKSNIEATTNEIKVKKTDGVKDSYDVSYNIQVKVIDQNNKQVKEYKMPGESTVIKTGDKWVINKIWSDKRELSVYFN
ncbi:MULTISPECIES: hypothetical protein [unclassified Paenibacillus]|uniref:hypothetical protein n=1 Tax=unclassified Paenibacillus TaxID=185978 RepID=UPI00097149DB|nr:MULTISPECIES: hypothetical protein [unclassified Paenibacillus]QID16135.1 hypothetical protein CIC07_25760 [Paenibacillus sp. RUD330]